MHIQFIIHKYLLLLLVTGKKSIERDFTMCCHFADCILYIIQVSSSFISLCEADLFLRAVPQGGGRSVRRGQRSRVNLISGKSCSAAAPPSLYCSMFFSWADTFWPHSSGLLHTHLPSWDYQMFFFFNRLSPPLSPDIVLQHKSSLAPFIRGPWFYFLL